jgi:hypothetical protein
VLKLKASGYIDNNNLYIVGVANSRFGTIPFTHREPVKGLCKSGPINIGIEQTDNIEKAIHSSKKPIINNILKEEIKSAVENLIERARQGDQNAIGILCQVRKNASKGYSRAAFSYEYALQYCKSKPINDLGIVSISGESVLKKSLASSPLELLKTILESMKNNPSKIASVISSHVANLDPEVLKAAAILIADIVSLHSEILQTVVKQNDENFIDGYVGKNNTDRSAKVGFVIGYAKKLQDFRDTGNLNNLSKQIAWELGE